MLLSTILTLLELCSPFLFSSSYSSLYCVIYVPWKRSNWRMEKCVWLVLFFGNNFNMLKMFELFSFHYYYSFILCYHFRKIPLLLLVPCKHSKRSFWCLNLFCFIFFFVSRKTSPIFIRSLYDEGMELMKEIDKEKNENEKK